MRLPVTLLVLVASPVVAAERLVAVEVGEAASLAAARKSGAAIAKKLELGERLADEPTLTPRRGAGLHVYRAGESYRLVAYAGEEGQARLALQLIRRHLPEARLTTHELPEDVTPLDNELVPAVVFVAGRDRSHPGAIAQATAVAEALGLPYDSRGLVWDSADGLVFPRSTDGSDYGTNPFDGAYFLRRTDACGNALTACVSVERADAYEGEAGELWVVAGLAFDDSEVGPRLEQLRRTGVPVIARPTWLWMGCPY